MNTETKVFVGIMGVTLALVVGTAVLLSGKSAPKPVNQADLVSQNSQVLGATDAKVTIVEFSDFECPACKAAQPALDAVLGKYRDRIRFVYRHFPLAQHVNGWPAAQAAESAALQGKFWEMHKVLFEKSPDLSKDLLFGYARDLGLDTSKFSTDYESNLVREKILSDINDAGKVGVNVTPTFFINGTKFEGVLSIDEFSREIDSRL